LKDLKPKRKKEMAKNGQESSVKIKTVMKETKEVKNLEK